jgi:hypothetical protein
MPWDSLSPVQVPPDAPDGQWSVLEGRLARSGPPRSLISGSDGSRRVVTVGASGFWRWKFSGGVSAAAYDALWGSVFDWLAAGRADSRAAFPADGMSRAGEPIRWRRGGADSTVVVELVRRGGDGRGDSLVLRFGEGANVATSPPLRAGIYEARVAGGTALLAVNASREALPRRATAASGSIGTGRRGTPSPRLRDSGMAYALLIAALCAEWLLRRRRGQR